MNIRYRFSVTPTVPTWGLVQELTAQAFASSLEDAIVHRFLATSEGYEAEITLNRPSHRDGLEQISGALEPIGLTVLRVVITEFADATVVGPVTGLLTFIGASAKTNHLAVAAVSGAVGSAIGVALARIFPIPINTYVATRSNGTWETISLGPPWLQFTQSS